MKFLNCPIPATFHAHHIVVIIRVYCKITNYRFLCYAVFFFLLLLLLLLPPYWQVFLPLFSWYSVPVTRKTNCDTRRIPNVGKIGVVLCFVILLGYLPTGKWIVAAALYCIDVTVVGNVTPCCLIDCTDVSEGTAACTFGAQMDFSSKSLNTFTRIYGVTSETTIILTHAVVKTPHHSEICK